MQYLILKSFKTMVQLAAWVLPPQNLGLLTKPSNYNLHDYELETFQKILDQAPRIKGSI